MGILKRSQNNTPANGQGFFFIADDRKWVVDIDKFTKMCLTSDSEQSRDTEVTEGFEITEGGSLTQTTKVVREVTSGGNMQNDTIKYDLIKTLLSVVLDKKMMAFGSLDNELKYDLSFNLAFNTLCNAGIIYELVK